MDEGTAVRARDGESKVSNEIYNTELQKAKKGRVEKYTRIY